MTEPVETLDIGTAVVAFLMATKTLGDAQKKWERRQDSEGAAAMTEAANAVETALGMLVVVLPVGLDQTRSEVDAWRARRALFVGGGLVGLAASSVDE